MTELTEHKIDRDGWPAGEWDSEPDRLQWTDESTGLPCLMVRNYFGNWCGYVGVPNGHRDYGVEYDELNYSVHGGLTYSDKCAGNVCHIPEAGQTDDVWWLGFDMGHGGDLAPRTLAVMPQFAHGVYKNVAYVKRECAELAKQLAHN